MNLNIFSILFLRKVNQDFLLIFCLEGSSDQEFHALDRLFVQRFILCRVSMKCWIHHKGVLLTGSAGGDTLPLAQLESIEEWEKYGIITQAQTLVVNGLFTKSKGDHSS